MQDADAARNARLGVRARHWARARARKSPEDARATAFRVVSYNFLAPECAASLRRSLYRFVGAHRLEWSRRSATLGAELDTLRADVLCAQEYDESEMETLDEALRRSGLERGVSATRSNKRDGCAIFYRASAFEMECTPEIVRFGDVESGLGDNVACVAVLRHRARDARVVVATAHLLFNPKRGDVKVGQARVLLEAVARARQMIRARGLEAHCVICGDYNFSPGSELYDFFSTGRIDLAQVNRRALSGALAEEDGDCDISDDESHDFDIEEIPSEIASETETLAMRAFQRGWEARGLALALGDKSTPFPSRTGVELEITQRATQKGMDVDEIRHLMRLTVGGCVVHHALEGELKSAYVTVDGREPEFTTCHGKYVGTNDYIWHTSDIEPISVLRCPSVEDILLHGRLPSVRYASDHISIVADFQIA